MGWLFVPALAGLTSGSGLPWDGDTALSVMLRSTHTRRLASWRGWKTRPWISRLSGTISRPSMAASGVELWTSSLRASRASLSRSPARAAASMMIDGSGHGSAESSAPPSRRSSSSRTRQNLLPQASPTLSGRLSISGLMRAGTYFPQKSMGRRIAVNGSTCWLPTPDAGLRGGGNKSPSPGAQFRPSLQTKLRALSRLPTPTASDAGRGVDSTKAQRQARGWTTGETLNDALHRLATPKARDCFTSGPADSRRRSPNLGTQLSTPMAHDCQGRGFNDMNLANQVGGLPHPAFHCWMMGFPLLWTRCDVPATLSFRLWLAAHSEDFGGDCMPPDFCQSAAP